MDLTGAMRWGEKGQTNTYTDDQGLNTLVLWQRNYNIPEVWCVQISICILFIKAQSTEYYYPKEESYCGFLSPHTIIICTWCRRSLGHAAEPPPSLSLCHFLMGLRLASVLNQVMTMSTTHSFRAFCTQYSLWLKKSVPAGVYLKEVSYFKT